MKQFTLDEAMSARRVLRDALGAGPESFSLPAFIGMLSDEIEKLRQAGQSDARIAAMMTEATGQPITEDDVASHYAPPDKRAR